MMQNNHIWNPDQGHTYPPKRSSTIFTNMNVSKFIFVGFASRILAKGTNFKTRLMTDVVMWSQELSWIVNIKLLYYCIFLDIICINKTVNRKQLCNIHCEKNPNIKYTLTSPACFVTSLVRLYCKQDFSFTPLHSDMNSRLFLIPKKFNNLADTENCMYFLSSTNKMKCQHLRRNELNWAIFYLLLCFL